MALGAVLLSSLGCQGPSSSPDSSVKNFYAAAGWGQFSAMYEIVSQASKARLGSAERGEAYFQNEFGEWKKFDVTIADWSASADGQGATVRFTCRAEMLVNSKASQVDCSDTYSLVKEEDGKFHLTLPGAQKYRQMERAHGNIRSARPDRSR